MGVGMIYAILIKSVGTVDQCVSMIGARYHVGAIIVQVYHDDIYACIFCLFSPF